MKEICDNVTVVLEDGAKIEIPVKVASGGAGIIPFNYKIGTEIVSWISAMPCAKSENEIYFTAIDGISPQICLDGKTALPMTSRMTIGGKTVILAEDEIFAPQKGEEIPLSASEKSSDTSFFSHIVNYDGTIPEFAEVDEYSFNIPDGTNYLVINAVGNIGALYRNDRLISDCYLRGDAWAVDVRRFDSESSFVLKILPLTEKDKEKIYFECDMPCGSIAPKVCGVKDEILYV